MHEQNITFIRITPLEHQPFVFQLLLYLIQKDDFLIGLFPPVPSPS